MPDIKQFLPVEEETLSEAAMWQTYRRGECTEADNFVAGSACTVGLLGLLTVKEVHGQDSDVVPSCKEYISKLNRIVTQSF